MSWINNDDDDDEGEDDGNKFRDNNWEQGKNFVKNCHVKKHVQERDGAQARAGGRVRDLG